MKKRSVMALVAGGLLTAMLPGMAAAQGSTSTDVTTLATLTRDYVWDGRLAGNLTNDYVWDGRLPVMSPASTSGIADLPVVHARLRLGSPTGR